jgi:hypothetical protein
VSFVVEARVEEYAVALSSRHPLDGLFERLAAETRERMSAPASALPPGGVVVTCDVDPEAQEIARR